MSIILALFPDGVASMVIAAAGINPLEHFLVFGVYEGRQAVQDGVWH